MSSKYRMADTAILMRISAGMPGKTRKDRALSSKVKTDNHLGEKSGAWIKNRFPDWALEPLEKLVTQARAYHEAVTLPFDTGIGILPGALIMEYGDRMRQFSGQFKNLIDSHFAPKYPEMIEWAKAEHNGTFDQSDYPPIEDMVQSFYFRTEPLPVPDAQHFESTMSSLLGIDAQKVNLRIEDAMQEARRELMRRLIEPVRNMAKRLAEPTPEGKKSPKFNDTLVGNIQDIIALAPKLNIAGDPAIDAFVSDMQKLCVFKPDSLRADAKIREAVATEAKELLNRLSGYKI